MDCAEAARSGARAGTSELRPWMGGWWVVGGGWWVVGGGWRVMGARFKAGKFKADGGGGRWKLDP